MTSDSKVLRRDLLKGAAGLATLPGPAMAEDLVTATMRVPGKPISPYGASSLRGSGVRRRLTPLYPEISRHRIVAHAAASAGRPPDRRHRHSDDHASHTDGCHWPYATSLFGYVRSAMSMTDPAASARRNLCALCLSAFGRWHCRKGCGTGRQIPAPDHDAQPQRIPGRAGRARRKIIRPPSCATPCARAMGAD